MPGYDNAGATIVAPAGQSGGGGGAGRVLALVTDDVAVSGTTSETTLATIPIEPGDAPAGSVLRLRLAGQFTNGTGGNVTMTVALKLGATTVFTVAIPGVGTAASGTRRWTIDLEMIAVSDAAQEWNVQAQIGNSVTNPISTQVNALVVGTTTTTVDTSDAVNLVATTTLPSATNCSLTLNHARLERVAA